MNRNELLSTAQAYIEAARELTSSRRLLTMAELGSVRGMLDRAQELRDQADAMDEDNEDPGRRSDPLTPGGCR